MLRGLVQILIVHCITVIAAGASAQESGRSSNDTASAGPESQISILEYFQIKDKNEVLENEIKKYAERIEVLSGYSLRIKSTKESVLNTTRSEISQIVNVIEIASTDSRLTNVSVPLAERVEIFKRIADVYESVLYSFSISMDIPGPVIRSSTGRIVEGKIEDFKEFDDKDRAEIQNMKEKFDTVIKNAGFELFNSKCGTVVELAKTLADKAGQKTLVESDLPTTTNDLKDCTSAWKSIESSKVFEEYGNLLDAFALLVERKLAAIRQKVDEISNQIIDNNKKLDELAKRDREVSLTRSGQAIDPSAQYVILMTLVAWTLIIGIIVWATIYILKSYVQNREYAVKDSFSFVLFLEIMTVFLLTGTILILGIANKLNTEGLAALIGGISGYVLGRMQSGRDRGEGVVGGGGLGGRIDGGPVVTATVPPTS